MAELISMKNIGKEIEKKLKVAGIRSAEELRQLGAKEVFFRLKLHYPDLCIMHLYSLQAAIDDISDFKLPEAVKNDLKSFYKDFK